MEFEYRGNSYYIEKDVNESDDIFFQRCWFIIKQEPDCIEKMNYLKNLSELWLNYKNLDCKYVDELQSELERIEKEYYEN